MSSRQSNLATLAFTALILLAGVLLPNFIYPLLDPYMNQVTELRAPSAGDSLLFPNPVTLYPWDIYDPRDTTPLTTTDRQLLASRGVADFLLASLADRGMPIDGHEAEYRARLLESFVVLVPANGSDPCFVLPEIDLDSDDTPDLQCAVSTEGDIIHLLFLDPAWSLVTLQPSPGDFTEDKTGNPADGQTDSAGQANGGNAAANQAATESNGQAANPAEANPDQQDVLDVATGDEPGDELVSNPAIDRQPPESDLAIWYSVYAVTVESESLNQEQLSEVFHRIDQHYGSIYGYSFKDWLNINSGLPPDKNPDIPDSSFRLQPVVWNYEIGNSLTIFDLPGGARVILYINDKGNCMGFNIQTP